MMTEYTPENQKETQVQIATPFLPHIISLIIMVIFDQLAWERKFGLQFFLLVILILLALFVLARVEKKHVPWRSYLLLAPILLGATMTILQKASSTTFFNIVLTLSGLILLAITLRNGQWLGYRIREVALGILLLIESMIVDPIKILIENKQTQKKPPTGEKNRTWRRIRPFFIGLVIAIPLLLIFGALLASADLIFRDQLSSFFDLFKIENLAELLFRTFYIITLGYFMTGAYVHALVRSAKEKNITPDKPLVQPFLGHVEAFIVLGLVNLLFLSFIIIQFRYFFAGQANISIEGFTYAEYARRGFFELIIVAVLSLGVFYLLSAFTKRPARATRRTFSALGILLMLQVGCMLISAFQRLSLYEAAYGFTTLRAMTYIFMIWLGVLIIAVALMEVFNQFKRLALVLLIIFFGFTITLNLLNLDRFITQRNIAHAQAGNPLDASYLVHNLSVDSVPALFEAEQASETPPELKEALTAILACKLTLRDHSGREGSWPEWHFSESTADRLFEKHRSRLENYPLSLKSESYISEEGGQRFEDTYQYYYFEVDGEEIYCMPVD
jgi:hypothetical protein